MTKVKSLFCCAVLLIVSVSCKREIIDFFEAIKDYGYRSHQPLGPKKIAVNEELLGGYVYDNLPVVISKKDAQTYRIEFLSVLLYKENAIVDAHATQLGPSTFLNLQMGDYYCFMKVNLILNQSLQIDLLKESVKQHIPEDKIKTWLTAHPGETQYHFTENNEEQSTELYFNFTFSKITVDEALRIQAERLRLARKYLFENCKSYESYENLIAKYPNDEFTALAVQSLFDRCETIADYEKFATYFSKDVLAENAKSRIAELKEEQRQQELMALDKRSFEIAKTTNTIEGYVEFKSTCNSKTYIDSADYSIAALARDIKKDQVEWKWTNGESQVALQFLYYKIEFMQGKTDVPWIIELLTLYTLQHNNATSTATSLVYIDKLANKGISSDDFLNLYISKAFLFWLQGDFDACLKTVELKLQDSFESGEMFKDVLKSRYESYVNKGISFPEQGTTWKKIKKLKIEK